MITYPQANYGGITVPLPKSLKKIFGEAVEEEEVEEEEVMEVEGDGKPEVQMNWNICKYLPEAASCQDIFQVMTVFFHSDRAFLQSSSLPLPS